MKYKYCGAIHIHSVLSDGTGCVEEIAKAAKQAGLSWIIITDHNNFDAKEGLYDGVCVIKGEEISPGNQNHYLAFDINKYISPTNDAQNFINEVRAQGGFGIVAHPKESETRKNHYPPINWLDKSITGDGVEIWNWMSDWADIYDEQNILNAAKSFLFRNNSLKGPSKETLEWWDLQNNNTEKIIPAIGGIDAHALKIKKYGFPLTIFSYKYMFTKLTNIIYLDEKLPDNFEKQKEMILKAIKQGNNIIINKHWSKKLIPEFFIKNKTECKYSGESIFIDDQTELIIESIKNTVTKIYKNGINIYTTEKFSDKIKIEKSGKYRIESYYKGKPWVYTNPIIVK